MQKKIKIGMNARPFASSSMRGIARHTFELIKNLHSENPSIEFYLYTYGKVDNFYKAELPYVKWRETKVSPKLLWDLWVLPKQIKEDGLDLFHSTNNLGLPFSGIKKVVTIHDDLTHRHRMNAGMKHMWGKFNYLIEYFLLKSADRFITISQAAKNEIIKTMHLPAEKFRVIYNGVNKHTLNPVINKEDFYLYVGGLEERKNIPFLIKELEVLQTKLNKKIQLKCISKLNSANSALKEQIKNTSFSITFLEDVSDNELFELYQKSKAVIIPSLLEGFGIPLVEAMEMGAPLFVSDIQVFKEVTELKAWFFDPHITGSLTDLLKKAEENNISFSKFNTDAMSVALKYDWQVMAKETMKTYIEILK
ncbi:MAG: glycosyltransferase family 4 protein [Rhizobacter sp.]|nr:glycosyltransferase family 4 protein [Bacteriovorax sp.]